MKKIILGFVLLTALCTPIVAGGIDIELQLTQTPYKWGGKNGNVFEYIIGETADEYIALRGTYAFFSYDYKIARYDKSTMNLLEVKPLFPKDYVKKGGIKPTYSWGINQYKEQIYFLFGYKDQMKDNITVYYQKLDNEGNVDGNPDKLVEAPFVKGSAGWFGGVYSYDSSKFLSVYEVPTKNKENQQYHFHVYNIVDMSLIFEREVELPFMDKDVNLIRYDVSDEGDVYGLVQIHEQREKGSKEPDNYTYKIYGFQTESDDVLEFDFDIDRYMNSITFQVKNGIIYCSGFWGKKNSSDISGVYSLRLDANNGEELVQDLYEFSDEFIEEFYTDKQVQKADKKGKELEVPTIVLDHFLVKDDGSAYVVGEQFYTYTVCYTTQNGTRCVTYYVHNDIMITKIDANGEILWATKIPKKSVSANSTGALSYHLHQKGDDLYFVYYDHVDNFDLVDPKKYDRVPIYNKDTDLICCKVNDDGEKEKVVIYNYADKAWNQLKLTPVKMQTLNGSEFIGMGFVKGRKEILGRFSIR